MGIERRRLMEEIIYTPQEVADLLKLKKNTVYEMIKRGDIRAAKLGKSFRILASDIDAYLGQDKKETTKSYVEEDSHLSFFPKEEPVPAMILCGQDLLLDLMANHLNRNEYGIQVLRSYLGSYNGLYAMYQKQVHIATAHLWDPETDTYNLPYIAKLLPGVPVQVYHLTRRMQGFYVRKGNPKNLTGFQDFGRSDLCFVNREKGSGTRVLLDHMLVKLNISPSRINGYKTEAGTHLAAASAVVNGGADFALGNERTSFQVKDIEFIPLKEESCDLVLREEERDHPLIKKLLELLRSDEFHSEIRGLGGYDAEGMGERLL